MRLLCKHEIKEIFKFNLNQQTNQIYDFLKAQTTEGGVDNK